MYSTFLWSVQTRYTLPSIKAFMYFTFYGIPRIYIPYLCFPFSPPPTPHPPPPPPHTHTHTCQVVIACDNLPNSCQTFLPISQNLFQEHFHCISSTRSILYNLNPSYLLMVILTTLHFTLLFHRLCTTNPISISHLPFSQARRQIKPISVLHLTSAITPRPYIPTALLPPLSNLALAN